MNRRRYGFSARSWLAAVVWVWTLPLFSCAATLADFGYQKWNTGPQRTTLAVLVSWSDTGITNTLAYWDAFVFNPTNYPDGLNAYYGENSGGQFSLNRAGILQINQPASNRIAACLARYGADGERWYHSNLVHQTMLAFNFAPYDADGSGVLNESELLILFLMVGEGGGVRPTGYVKPAGAAVAWNGCVATADMTWNSYVKYHEASHLLGAVDLYGIWGTDNDLNNGLTIMSTSACHLDPWHKMRFGWSRPRCRALRAGGLETLYAAQLERDDAPLLLYDLDRGVQEFFLLEYRTRTCSRGRGFEQELAGDGLVIWHVYHDAEKNAPTYAAVVYPDAGKNLHECRGCGCLVHRTAINSLTCPAGGKHHPFIGSDSNPGDEHWAVTNKPADPGQHGWRRCSNCGGIYYSPNVLQSVCPAGGTHQDAGWGDISLPMDVPNRVGHNNWRRCTKCQLLCYGNARAASVCPADGGAHAYATNRYTILAAWSDITMLAEAAPDLLKGGNTQWTSGSATPELRWYDGSSTGVRVYTKPFTNGADTVTVEWLNAGAEVWVDFAFTGSPENGTFSNPYNTIAEGLAAVPRGGTLRVKAGTSAERPRTDKRMRITAEGGRVTIGR